MNPLAMIPVVGPLLGWAGTQLANITGLNSPATNPGGFGVPGINGAVGVPGTTIQAGSPGMAWANQPGVIVVGANGQQTSISGVVGTQQNAAQWQTFQQFATWCVAMFAYIFQQVGISPPNGCGNDGLFMGSNNGNSDNSLLLVLLLTGALGTSTSSLTSNPLLLLLLLDGGSFGNSGGDSDNLILILALTGAL